ncbi:hypothetical protein RIR_jg6130.t1 [Rhizophagus irregularis DAOM 181602=DAOM 197198]|nr:hypothetical protein RIR_jg6130.t1 [Rhizophagus irregularis DAOM 181602=DAOM 197198]
MLNEIVSMNSLSSQYVQECLQSLGLGLGLDNIHFLQTGYNKVLVRLKPLSYSSALKMFFDKYDPDDK